MTMVHLTSIVILSFTVGLLAGTSLTYTLIKSYRAAAIGAVGALINTTLLVVVLSLR